MQIKDMIVMGSGAQGSVLYAEDIINHEPVALKIPKHNKNNFNCTNACNMLNSNDSAYNNGDYNYNNNCCCKSSVVKNLQNEAAVYQRISGAPGFPIVKHYSDEQLVLELLGSNVGFLFDKVDHFSLKTVLIIADQALARIEYLHEKGYLHNDIKPENFVVGKKGGSIYMIDFGLATTYVDLKTGEHLPFCDKSPFVGTVTYASINAHKGWRLSRRDDLESLAYVLIYLLNGSLPWSTFSRPADILYSKINTSTRNLCDGLPKEFEAFINNAKCLGYTDKPHYAEYRKMFRDLFIEEGFIYDNRFEWSNIYVSRSLDGIAENFSQNAYQDSSSKRKSSRIKSRAHSRKKERKHCLLIYPSS